MFDTFKELYKSIKDSKHAFLFAGIIYTVIPFLAFYLMESYEHNPFGEVRSKAIWFNILLFELIGWILFLLIGRARIALWVELVAAMVFGLTNHYVMEFRSTPFVPWDIFSVGTAASVAGNYDFTPTLRVVVVTLLFLATMFLVFFLKFKIKIKIYFRLIPTAILTLILCFFVSNLQNEEFQTANYLYPFLFTPVYMTKVNGMAVTFAMDLAYVAVDKPSGYSAEKAEKLLNEYAVEGQAVLGSSNQTAESGDKDYPNIIVIMDEAFSDLAVLGDFTTNEDYMPFVHSLQQGSENTITGYLDVSVCGGNTANSEFEFLTGDTMAFLPTGSIPYQQYLKDETPSLASHLKELGYATYAQHPYYSDGWNRDKVYPLLGFDNSSFIDDYTGLSYERKYVSDQSDFNYIISTFENQPANQPAFIFNVTMQNHGGYTDSYDNFTNSIFVDGINSDAVSQYLSLLSLTDQSLEELIDYFSTVDEKTIIVFFGDHQPNNTIASQILALNGKDYNNLSEEDTKNRYKVPYFVWANYDIEEASDEDMSLNYLGANVLKTAGVPTSAYQNFLLQLQDKYPSISGAGKVEAETDEKKELIDKYKLLQYYNIFK